MSGRIAGVEVMEPHKQQKQLHHPQKQRHHQQPDNAAWLLNLSVTALAAAGLVLFGHWFSSKQGRCIGGRGLPKDNEANNATLNQVGRPKSLAELRAQRLKALEARSHCRDNEPSTTRPTPFGMILLLTEKIDKLEEEVSCFLASMSQGTTSVEKKKEHDCLLDRLVEIQLEVDAVKVDEIVRPHRKIQTNRIQYMIVKLDKVR